MFRTGAAALIAVTLGAIGAPTTSQAATFLTVGPNSLCGENGCFAGDRKSFTQTFSTPERGSGILTVSQLQVFKAIVGATDHMAVKVTFVLADGTERTWGKYSLKALGGDVVTLGGQAVAWDTSLGDLTVRLDLIVPEKPGAGGGGGFAFGGGGGGGLGGGYAVAGGPVGVDSGFGSPSSVPVPAPSLPNGGGAAAVPEPGAWALMILGFGAAGSILRRRSKSLKYS